MAILSDTLKSVNVWGMSEFLAEGTEGWIKMMALLSLNTSGRPVWSFLCVHGHGENNVKNLCPCELVRPCCVCVCSRRVYMCVCFRTYYLYISIKLWKAGGELLWNNRPSAVNITSPSPDAAAPMQRTPNDTPKPSVLRVDTYICLFLYACWRCLS